MAKDETQLKMYDMANLGLDTTVVKEMEAVYGIPKPQMAHLMGVSEKTYYNAIAKPKLDRDRSDRFLFISKIFDEGENTFGSAANFKTWLYQPHPSLNNHPPIKLMESLNGAQAVHAEIIRTKYGVLS